MKKCSHCGISLDDRSTECWYCDKGADKEDSEVTLPLLADYLIQEFTLIEKDIRGKIIKYVTFEGRWLAGPVSCTDVHTNATFYIYKTKRGKYILYAKFGNWPWEIQIFDSPLTMIHFYNGINRRSLRNILFSTYYPNRNLLRQALLDAMKLDSKLAELNSSMTIPTISKQKGPSIINID